MRIYHVATTSDWETATRAGTYAVSTRGRTVEQEGFIHAAHQGQVPDVLARYFADVDEPLVVLEIETALLDVDVRDEQVGDELFPHIFGPIRTHAIVDVRPVRPRELDGSAADRVPPPSTVSIFHGLAFVLAAAVVALFLSAALAHQQARTSNHAEALRAAQFVLWSLSFSACVCALASWAAGNAALNRHRDLTTWRR